MAEHYLKEFIAQTGRPVTGFSHQAIELMQRYRWPGNVRELVNVIERAVVLSKAPVIGPNDLPEALRRDDPLLEYGGRMAGLSGNNLKSALANPEKQLILDSLESHGWNRQDTADALGINRTTLYKKMKKYGISFEKQLMMS